MSDFTKTTDRIRGLVPRLMELTLGCRVDDLIIVSYRVNRRGKKRFKCIGVEDGEFYSDVELGIDDKIIGHPITIEGVLEATKDTLITCEQTLDMIAIWEFGKDLDHQKKETKQFITDILFSN